MFAARPPEPLPSHWLCTLFWHRWRRLDLTYHAGDYRECRRCGRVQALTIWGAYVNTSKPVDEKPAGVAFCS